MANFNSPYVRRVQSQRASSARPKMSNMVAEPRDSSGFLSNFDEWFGNLDSNDLAGGINQGLSSYGQGVADTYDFSVDPHAGYKGSFQGLAQNGVVGAIAGGIGGQMGTFSEVNKNLKNLNTDVNLLDRSATGQPVYTSGGYLDAQRKIGALNEGEDSTKMFWDGGKSYDPATVAFDKVFGTSDKIRDSRKKLRRNLSSAQQEYNQSSEEFFNHQLAIDDYYRRLNNDNMLYNLYR